MPEYVSVGAVPGVLRHQVCEQPALERTLTQCLAQCVLLSRRGRTREDASKHARMVSALLAKILQRGRIPLPSLGLEREALREHGFLEDARDLSEGETEMGWELQGASTARVSAASLLAALARRCEFSLDPEFAAESSPEPLLQSPEEKWFLETWVPSTLGPSAGHWFTPQASLDTLLESGGVDESGNRRMDFLFHFPDPSAIRFPGRFTIGVEIDGEEHVAAAAVDRARDRSLESVGINVLRISHHEIRRGRGVVLDELESRCKQALASSTHSKPDHDMARFLLDCSNAAKVQFAIVRAIGWGWLTAGQQWSVSLGGAGGSTAAAVAAVRDVLDLLSGLDALYGDASAPERTSAPATCTVHGDNIPPVSWSADKDGNWHEIEVEPSEPQSEILRLVVESNTSRYHRLDADPRTDLIMRPAFLPVDFAIQSAVELSHRPRIAPPAYDRARKALTVFLRTVFRKYKFRQRQGEAVYKALRRQDCVVLLPTGAGKSLIYQLAGLLMPGVTIVVDPIISLIEDQIDGLRSYGIDRAAPLTQDRASPQVFTQIEKSQYHFVLLTPERLQTRRFRSALQALAQVSFVNLAVIDEAHCISEWGHDFRPAYLHLADNLRRFGKDREGRPPTLLALTGTASRAVLRDMLLHLGIDRNRSDALIRPESFDRPELSFEVVRTRPTENPDAALRGVMNSMPTELTKLRLSRSEFYQPAGRDTASGIIFVPRVNARHYGLTDVRSTVRTATRADVTMYSGGAPRGELDWADKKRENARKFKDNETPILVATKAFGMGIDKPNIRYTVHFGMPGSLESFYQEAGRAGRDGEDSRCVIVFSEFDEGRSDALLDPDLDLPELRRCFDKVERERTTDDDVTRALWLHLQGFHGQEREIEDVVRVLDELGDLSASRISRLLPMRANGTRERTETALSRLVKLGVISDYRADFGSQQFSVEAERFDFGRCKERLLHYVCAAQPAKSKLFSRQLDEIIDADPHHAASELARVLITFIYDVVERSRRRMIQEAVLLARRACTDDDIRTRLLDYLQEGLHAERMKQLLDQPEVSLSSWCDLVKKCQTPGEAGELRGLCVRTLETYPDHPGLLLTRAVAEAMCSDHDEAVSLQGIGTAIRRSIKDYDLEEVDVQKTIEALFELALERARVFGVSLGVSLTVALLGLDDSDADLAFAVRSGLARADQFDDDRVRSAVTILRMRRIVGSLEDAVLRLHRQYERPGVQEALRPLGIKPVRQRSPATTTILIEGIRSGMGSSA